MDTNYLVEVIKSEHRLVIKQRGNSIKSYPIATGKYPKKPKSWGWDYRTPVGDYFVVEVCKRDSLKLIEANKRYYPWYLAHKFRDLYEDAGNGVYGNGMIILNYPNADDLDRFWKLKRSRELRKLWGKFCEFHWKPIYQHLAQQQRKSLEEVSIEGDFGLQTYQELFDSFPVDDYREAFRSGVVIHGTNDPECIGHNISGGCIRMHNRDIEELVDKYVVLGNSVIIND